MLTDNQDHLSLIFPLTKSADRVEVRLRAWSEFLQKELGREYEILVVADGVSNEALDRLGSVTGSIPRIRLIRCIDQQIGFGACLRRVLNEAQFPIIGYVGLDYPYEPRDLPKLLKRLGESVPVYDKMMTVEAASGCRTGRPVPLGWRMIGACYRKFCRIVLGIQIPALEGWLGFGHHFRAWALWLSMGIPLVDSFSAFKVFRRSLFDRFPIQCDSDFVHAEIFAKLTFLSVLVTEESLTPCTEPIPSLDLSDSRRVVNSAKFHTSLPDLTQPVPSPAT